MKGFLSGEGTKAGEKGDPIINHLSSIIDFILHLDILHLLF